jgi:hypothetical protein
VQVLDRPSTSATETISASIWIEGRLRRRLDLAIAPPHFALKHPVSKRGRKAGADASGTAQQQVIISIVGKAYGRLGLVRAARAMCTAGAAPADVTGDALVREMFRPPCAAAPAGGAGRAGSGDAAGDEAEDRAAAAELAETASEPELAIKLGPPGVCADFLPWQVRAPAPGYRQRVRAVARPPLRAPSLLRWRACQRVSPGRIRVVPGAIGDGAGRRRWRRQPPRHLTRRDSDAPAYAARLCGSGAHTTSFKTHRPCSLAAPCTGTRGRRDCVAPTRPSAA